MIDKWTKDGYRFTCEVEYWPSDGSKARAYWNYGTDKKFGGPGKSGYFIEIKMFPQNYWLSKKIHGWIRQVRPFKGPHGPGDIDQFWRTGKTEEEEEILFEVRDCLQDELSGITYSKEDHRISQHGKKPSNVYPEDKIESSRKKNRYDSESLWNTFEKMKFLPRSRKTADEDVEHPQNEGGAGFVTSPYNDTSFTYSGYYPSVDYPTHGTMPKDWKEEKEKEEIKRKEEFQKSNEQEAKKKEKQAKRTYEEDQKRQTRKAAPKKAIAIVFVAAIIAGVFVLGNGDISLPDISLPDITGCKTLDSEIINPGPNQDEIYLKLCDGYITVSEDLHKNTKVMMELRNPDGDYFRPVTFVDKIDWKIPTETVEKDLGTWKIKITVNGKFTGNVFDFDIVKP